MLQISQRLAAIHTFIARGGHLVVLQFLLMGIFALCPVWQPGLDTAQLTAWQVWRFAIAMPFAIIALVFGALGSHYLRDYLTPFPHPVAHNQLVTHGIYAVVRHPLYASLLFIGFAWTLYQFSLSHAGLLVVAFIFFDFKARREETWLTARHPHYAEYAQQVCKFIPWVY